jgi:hypothetical protein
MNFLQLCQKANTLSGLQGVVSNAATATGYQATLVEFVAQAWIDIQDLRKDWPFMRDSVSFTTTASQSEYTLLQIFGVDVSQTIARWVPNMILYIDSNSYSTALLQYTYDQYVYQDIAQQDTGLPNRYAEDPVDKHLYINPPDSTYNITAHFYTLPVRLSGNTDTPTLPLSYHMLIAYQGAAHMAAYMGNSNLFQINQQKATAMIGMLMRSELPAKKMYVRGIV